MSQLQAKETVAVEAALKQGAGMTTHLAFFSRKVRRSSLGFLTLFMTRALLFCLNLVYVEEFLLQVLATIGLCLIHFGSLLHCRHYLWTNPAVQALQVLNETTVLVFMTC